MIDFFNECYNRVIKKNKILNRLRLQSIVQISIRLMANILLPVYLKSTSHLKEYSISTAKKKKKGNIVVSLTSFPTRIARLWLVIESILRQTKKPDRIILYLSKLQFQNDKSIPSSLIRLKKRGLEIMMVDSDLRSHKKYFYTFSKYPDDYIITIDDDIIYRKNMIQDLISGSQNSGSIVAQYCKKIKWEGDSLMPYQSWVNIVEETEPTSNIFFGSGGGVMFPPGSLHPDTINQDLFMTLCPTADDIWLNAMCHLNGSRIKKIKCPTDFLPVMYLNNITLEMTNNGQNQNDKQITDVINYYLESRKIKLFKPSTYNKF